MEEEERNHKSIIELIIDEMVQNIQNHTEFGVNMVRDIKELADEGCLTKHERIMALIREPRAE